MNDPRPARRGIGCPYRAAGEGGEVSPCAALSPQVYDRLDFLRVHCDTGDWPPCPARAWIDGCSVRFGRVASPCVGGELAR